MNLDDNILKNGVNINNKDMGFIDDFMTLFFIFSGIWKSKTNHQSNLIIGLINLTVLSIGFVSISYMFILKYDDIDVNTEILLHFVEISFSICAQLLILAKNRLISRLAEDINLPLDRIELPKFNYEKYIQILEEERSSFWKIIRLACSSIVSVYITIALDTSYLLIKGRVKLPYPSWFPFETDNEHLWYYTFASIFEVVIYVEMLCIDIAIAGLWYAVVNKVSGLLTILGLSVQALSQEREEQILLRTHDPEKHCRGFQKKIKSCVDLHNYIKDLVNDLNASMGLMFVELIVSSQIAIVFCGYHVVLGASTDDKTRLFKYAGGVGVFTLMLLLYCASGQKLKNKSEELFISLYDCQWYQQSQAGQRSFYLCQTISKKPLVVMGAQVAPADLHTFMASIRAVFSYLNFLLAMKEKA